MQQLLSVPHKSVLLERQLYLNPYGNTVTPRLGVIIAPATVLHSSLFYHGHRWTKAPKMAKHKIASTFSTITYCREKKKSPGCAQDWTGKVISLSFVRLMHLYSNSFVMPGKQSSLCTPDCPAPNPGPRMIPCTLWTALPHFTTLHIMENDVIVAFPHNFKETPFLSYFKGI